MIGEAPVLLGQVIDERAARALAARLVAEGVAAEAEGPRVWVRPGDRGEALVLARLFHEVDLGRSRVAPPPGAWLGTRAGRMVRASAVVGLVLPAIVALAVAIRL